MSTLFSPVNVFGEVLFAVILGWRIHLLVRAPTLPNWTVTITIGFFAAAFLFQQQVVVTWFDGLAGRGGARVANNALLASGLCTLIVFFLGSTLGPRRDRYRRVLLEVVPAVAAIVAMVVAMAATPEAQRGSDTTAKTVHTPGIAVFYLGAGLYLIYGLLACTWWITRYQRVADRHLRTGLRISAVGLSMAAAGSVLRALYIVIAWLFGPAVPALLPAAVPLVILGIVGFLFGITFPGVRARAGALGLRRRHRREHRQLAPLWTALAKAYPTIVLREGPKRRGDRLRPKTVHRAYYRRVIEIRDGLVQLSPYLDADLAELAASDPQAAARALSDALARQEAGEASSGKAKLVLPAGAGDIESDVRPLLALSAALPGNGS